MKMFLNYSVITHVCRCFFCMDHVCAVFREVVLLAMLCDAVAQGLIQTSVRADQESPDAGKGGVPLPAEKTKKGRGKSVEKSGSTQGPQLDAAAVLDVKRALEVRDCFSVDKTTVYPHTHTHTHTHTLTYTHAHAHSHLHTRTHTLSLAHTHSRLHTHTLTYTHAHTHTRLHTRTRTLTYSHRRTRTLKHSHIHAHTHSHTYTLTLTHTLALTYSCTHTLSLTHAHTRAGAHLGTTPVHSIVGGLRL